MTFTFYNALIVDPKADSRARLREATSAIPQFNNVVQSSAMNDCLSRFRSDIPWNVVFISSEFSDEDISLFIKQCKETHHGSVAAYVLVLKTRDQTSQSVANNVLSGADGFLCEPFSSDALLKITELASAINKERAKARHKKAVLLVMPDIMRHLDHVATMISSVFDSAAGLGKLKRVCEFFREVPEDSLDVTYDAMIESFETAMPPKAYKGVSNRLKKKLQDKMASELGVEAAQAKGTSPDEAKRVIYRSK